MDLTARIEAVGAAEQRRAELDRREREHGGLIPSDRDTESARRSASGWGPYRPDALPREVAAARAGLTLTDPRRVTLQRLYVDCGAAVRRFAPAFKRGAADALRNDALMLLVQWPTQGDKRPIDLGGAATLRRAARRRDAAPTRAHSVLAWIAELETLTDGTMPLRRDWLETVERADGSPELKLTAAAWRALHAAVKQAAAEPSFLALTHRRRETVERNGKRVSVIVADDRETASDPLDIAAAVETQQIATDAPTRLPDNAAPDVIARAMDIPLDAARAIVARAYPAASPADLAAAWQMSPDGLKKALQRGAAHVRRLYPDPTELLTALDASAAAWRAETEQSAILTLLDYRDGMSDESRARAAVDDWRGASAGLPADRLALLGAARAALRRNGAPYGSARAELMSQTIARLIPAEHKRARNMATAGARGSHLGGATLTMPEQMRPILRATDSRLTAADRATTYRLTARDDRDARS